MLVSLEFKYVGTYIPLRGYGENEPRVQNIIEDEWPKYKNVLLIYFMP